MSSKRFNQIVNAAYQNNDVQLMRDAYYEYQDKHCLYPTHQNIFDSHLGTMRTIEVPCGHCYHCQQTKINEWTTRMYAHAEDFKHVYFITLTYRSITNPDLPVNKLFLKKMVQAVWNNDPYNSTKHKSYNPCLLVKKHYQDFFKRLRKNTGIKDLTYVVSGEYGHEYGRPHFHAILFTNSELTKEDIQRAWSFQIWHKNDGSFIYRTNQSKDGTAYNMPIGKIDFHDLVSNGTFNTSLKIKVDGSFMNSANCFSYVCKYVVKREDANLNRVRLAYRNLFKKFTIPNTTGKTKHDVLFYNRSSHFTLEQIYKLSLLNLNVYEKNLFQPAKSIFKHGLCRSRQIKNNGFFVRQEVLPEFYSDFLNSYLPFCEFSRATPIGSIYASRHVSEFAQGVFNKPLLQTNGFVVPFYFRSKAQEYTFGLRKVHRTLKSESLVLGNLPDLYRRFSESVETGIPLREYFDPKDDYQYVNEMLHDPARFFVDKSTHERIVLYNNHAQFYKYSRKDKSYKFTRALPVADWLRDCTSRLENELSDYESRLRISKQNMRFAESAKLKLLDFGLDDSILKGCYLSRHESIRNQKQLDYLQQHINVE